MAPRSYLGRQKIYLYILHAPSLIKWPFSLQAKVYSLARVLQRYVYEFILMTEDMW